MEHTFSSQHQRFQGRDPHPRPKSLRARLLRAYFGGWRIRDRLVRHLLFLSLIKVVALIGLWLLFFQNSTDVTEDEVSRVLFQEGPQQHSGFVTSEDKR